MGIAYYSQEDAQMRLNRTICRYKGLPVYVEVYNEDPTNTLRLSVLPLNHNVRRVTFKILSTDPDFVHRSPELGYLNHKWGDEYNAWYYSRSPKRKQQQGLSAGNVDVFNAHGPHFSDVSLSQCFCDMIVGVYPKFDDCLERVMEGDVKGVAFHRYACIRRIDGHNISLFFKERMVAMYHPRMQCFNFLPGLRDSSYLNAFFNRIGVPV